MEFIISESKLESVMFKYLDTIFDSTELFDDIWFHYKGSREMIAKYDYVNNSLRVSSFGTKELSDMFSIDGFDEGMPIVKRWLISKLGDRPINEITVTPYKLYVPSFIFTYLNK